MLWSDIHPRAGLPRWIGLCWIGVICWAAAVPVAAKEGADSTRVPAVRPQAVVANHSVGFGAGYRPGPGLRIFGEYAYTRPSLGTLALMLGWNEAFVGSAGVRRVIDLAEVPRRQLALSAELFSEYEPDLLLEGEEADERRTGVDVRAEWRARPPRTDNLLALYVAGRRMYVHLGGPSVADTSAWVTLLDAGARYLWTGAPLGPERRFRLEPAWRLGLDAPLDVGFAVFSLAGGWQQALGASSVLLVEGRGQWASSETPAFERTSLGGLLGVRGYREGITMGRWVWIVQNEVWTPVPGVGDALGGVASWVDRFIRLAAFVDVGGVHGVEDHGMTRAAAEPGGLRAGLGVGLRVPLGIATLRVDWAHAVEALAEGEVDGGVYFSIGTAAPF